MRSRRGSPPRAHSPHPLHDCRGTTLLEFLIMLVLFAGVAGAVYEFAANGAQAAGLANNFLQSQGQVRAALDNIVDETRWAQSVTAASATSVTLAVPQNTPFSPVGPYTVTFAYDPVNLVLTRQQDASPAVTIAYLVAGSGGSTGVNLSYFDGGGTALGSTPSTLGAITRLRINVSATSGGVTRTLASDAALRGF